MTQSSKLHGCPTGMSLSPHQRPPWLWRRSNLIVGRKERSAVVCVLGISCLASNQRRLEFSPRLEPRPARLARCTIRTGASDLELFFSVTRSMGGTLGGTMPVTLQHIRIADGDRAEMDGTKSHPTLCRIHQHPPFCASRGAREHVRNTHFGELRHLWEPGQEMTAPCVAEDQKGDAPVWGPKYSSAAGSRPTAWRRPFRRGMQVS